MRRRLFAIVAVVALLAGGLAGQSAAKKTPWGDPDLQGVYTFSTLTPLQRPDTLAGKVALTEAELAEQEDQDAQNRVNEDRPLARFGTVLRARDRAGLRGPLQNEDRPIRRRADWRTRHGRTARRGADGRRETSRRAAGAAVSSPGRRPQSRQKQEGQSSCQSSVAHVASPSR